MAIIIDKDGNVVTVENEPEAARAMFPNIKQDFSAEIASILDRLSIIHPGIHPGTIGSSGAINPPTEAEAGVYTDEFPVMPGDVVTSSLKYSEAHLMLINVVFYDISHAFIQRKTLYLTTADMHENYFVVPDNVYYCRFSYLTYNEGYLNIKTSGQRLNDVQFKGESIVKNGVAYIPNDAPYRKIHEEEITESTADINITADDDGNLFSLTDVIILFESMLGSGAGHCFISVNTPGGQSASKPLLTSYNLYNATTPQTRAAIMSVKGGRFIGYANDANYADYYAPGPLRANKNAMGFIECGPITQLKIGSLNNYTIESGKITVYGR